MKLAQIFISGALAVAGLAMSACSSPPVGAAFITKLEARSLPADVVKRRTLDQLTETLHLTSDRGATIPVNVLEFLPFELPARLTSDPNLCQKDWLFVSFGHEAQENPDSATPVRANGVGSRSGFSFLPHPANDEACRGLSDDVFFHADSEYDARNAASVLAQATEQIRGERSDFEVSCPYDKIECLKFLGAFDLHKVRSASACNQIGDPGDCWAYSYGDSSEVEIKTDYDKGRKTIRSIKVIERYVHINQRID